MYLSSLSRFDSFRLTNSGVTQFMLLFPDIKEMVEMSTIFRVIGRERVADLGKLIIIRLHQGTMRYGVKASDARKIEVTTSLVAS